MAVDPPECSGSSPPPGGLWHTPGHLKLLHLKQEDKGGGGGGLGQALRAKDPGVPSSARWRSGTRARAWRKTVWEEKPGKGGEGLRQAERLASWGAGRPGSYLLLVSDPGAGLACTPSQASTLDGQRSPTPRHPTTALLRPEKAMSPRVAPHPGGTRLLYQNQRRRCCCRAEGPSA